MTDSTQPRRPVADAARRASRGGGVRFLLAALLAYTAWAWGGLRPSFHAVGVGLAVVLLGWTVVRHAPWEGWRRDPVVWLGAAFLGYLALQWFNAGREPYFDVGHHRWSYTPPPHPGWPSAFARADALQMLTWFFPAWVVAIVLRARVLDRCAVKGLLYFLAWNAGALAVFGLAQFLSGTTSIYWIRPLESVFFSTFAYGNHAAPFFVLSGALAAGLAYRDLFDRGECRRHGVSPFRVRHPWRAAGLVGVLLLCLLGANLGLSRTGIILSWLFAVFAAGYGLLRGWRLLRPAERLNMGALMLGVAGLLYFAVAGMGGPDIRREMAPTEADAGGVETLWQRIDLELGHRPVFARAALDIWREHPWLGVGGWGYKYLVAEKVPADLWALLEKRGWANVHNDVLQFLTEFGLVGGGLLLAALAVMVRPCFRRACRRDSLWTLAVAGLVLVVGFSLIDIPFRSPAILYLWLTVLGALPIVCGARGGTAAAGPGRAYGKETGS